MLITFEQKSRDVSQVFLSNKNTNSTFDIVVYAKMSFEKTFEFTAAVWGYSYRRYLGLKTLTTTMLFFEPDSAFDQFAIKVCQEEGQKIPIGHLSR